MSEALREASGLGQATDELNVVICRAEKVLEQLALGVRAEVPLPDSVSDPIGRRLGFGKGPAGWGLYVRTDHGVNPLCNTSRETRTDAVVRIPDLVEALRAEAVYQEQAIRDVTQRLSEYLDGLASPPPAPEAEPT